ncbi:MAG: EI24 domain-containing protein [Desulfamplus sp.]|nr:EI24 domain-containing protein [Desulfamplus sp.]
MEFIKGIVYNFKGVGMALTSPLLLFLGILRFLVVVTLTIAFSAIVFMYHQEILSMLWAMPESSVMLFFWNILSWLLSMFLAVFAAIFAYFTAQLLFAVFIMDYMSRITEKKITGMVKGDDQTPLIGLFLYLILQEIPRAVIPVMLMILLILLGLVTPFGAVIAGFSSLVAGIFLAWDNTDLVPARRMEPFGGRFAYLKKNIMFHMGFGVLFLIPWLNILFLSFAPVGGTLYYINHERELRENG